jgi:hypothetical protein
MASARAALRSAISEREAAKVHLLHAKQAEQRGHDLHLAREQELAFADVDLAIVQFQTEMMALMRIYMVRQFIWFKRGLFFDRSRRPGCRQQKWMQ